MPPATFDFGGKVVLVTGVGRAGQIGNAVALAFGTAGAKIVACDVNAVGVAERVREFAAAGVDARPCAGDLIAPDIAALAVETALRHFGRLDAVVNVAGGLTTYGPIEQLTRRGLRPRAVDQSQDDRARLPGRHRRARARPRGASSTSRRSPTSSRRARWPSTRRPRPPWRASRGASRWSWRTGKSGSTPWRRAWPGPATTSPPRGRGPRTWRWRSSPGACWRSRWAAPARRPARSSRSRRASASRS